MTGLRRNRAVVLREETGKVLLALVVLGTAVFLGGLFVDASRTWQIMYVNFLFWSGLAQGGVVVSGVYRMTNSHWSEPFRGIAEGTSAFLPVSFVLLLVMMAGGRWIFPWWSAPVPGKALWLSPQFLFGRQILISAFLLWLSLKYVAASALGEKSLLNGLRRFHAGIPPVLEAASVPPETARLLSRLTPLLLVSFGILFPFVGFDLAMSLDPSWSSTLFGWMYALHAFYGGIVATMLFALASHLWLGLDSEFGKEEWRDMANLVLGISLLSGGFAWSQYLVIWYGNLPEETSFLVSRFHTPPWPVATWLSIFGAYFLGLFAFIVKPLKEHPAILFVIGLLILKALFLERFVLVVPWLWHGRDFPFGFLESFVTLGFASSFVWVWLFYAKKMKHAGNDSQ